jgi:hypothetical protein
MVCTERSGEQCASGGVVTLTDWLRNEGVAEEDIEAECSRRQGTKACVDGSYIPFDNPRGAHVIPLGGNNPFLAGIYEGVSEPIVTTPIVLERYVLNACGERAARDREGAAEVFTDIDLESAAIDAESAGLKETVDELYKRLLSRIPTAEERASVLILADESPLTGEEFARLSCFVVATLPEFTFQ